MKIDGNKSYISGGMGMLCLLAALGFSYFGDEASATVARTGAGACFLAMGMALKHAITKSS